MRARTLRRRRQAALVVKVAAMAPIAITAALIFAGVFLR